MMNNKDNIDFMFRIFKNNGKQLYLVGGCCRDMVMGRQPHDYDFATNATPAEMRILFENVLDDQYLKNNNIELELLPTGEKYGTMTFLFKHGDEMCGYEVTAYRKDGRYTNGRSPESISFASSIEEDLERRDFTMNAIAYNPQSGFMDPYNGRKAISRKIIACVGSPVERLKEDLLRAVRAVRFSCVLGFSIDGDTDAAITATLPHIRPAVSEERIGAEMRKILSTNMESSSLFSLLHQLYDVDEEEFSLLKKMQTVDGRMFVLFSHMDDEKAKILLTKGGFGKFYIRGIPIFKQAFKKLFEDGNIYAFLATLKKNGLTKGGLDYLRFISPSLASKCWEAIGRDVPLDAGDLEISGEEIISFGFFGKSVGQIQQDMLQYIWDGKLSNDKSQLLTFIKEKKHEQTKSDCEDTE